MKNSWIVVAALFAWTPGSAQDIALGEYQQRRHRMFDAVSDGILLIHSRTVE